MTHDEATIHFEKLNARILAERTAIRRRHMQIGSLIFGILLIASLFIFRAEISALLGVVLGYIIGGIFTIAMLMLVGIGGAGGAITGFLTPSKKRRF